MKKITQGVFLYLGIVLFALLFLAAGAMIPQQIDAHVLESAERMLTEGNYPKIADYSTSAQLDNFTDAIILAESKAMNSENFSSILLNRVFYFSETREIEDPV